jgi:sugar-specific transcriptional regulator TrmB
MEKIFIVMLNLYFIINLQPSNQGIKITLQNEKVVTLSKSHESYEHFTELIIHALKRKHPVGLAISKDNKILSIERADNDFVEKIISKDEETFIIQFQGHDGFFSLDRNHPSFDKIYTILERSRINFQRVWFIAQLPKLQILDVILVEEK